MTMSVEEKLCLLDDLMVLEGHVISRWLSASSL